MDDVWDTVVRNKKSLGLDQRVFADTKTRKFRKQIYDSDSVDKIRQILQSPAVYRNRDTSVYTAAVRRSGELGDWKSCIDLMNTALSDDGIKADHFLYCELFKALNLNGCPKKSDLFLKRMVTVDQLSLNVVTVAILLNGCRGIGYAERARKIWKMMLSHNITPDISCYVNMIKTLGQNGDIEEAKRYYKRILKELDDSQQDVPVALHGVMMHALLKNNKIEEALVMKEEVGIFTQTQYVPLIAYYLREDSLDPQQALKLIQECIVRTGMTKLDRFMTNIKYVTLFRALEREQDTKV